MKSAILLSTAAVATAAIADTHTALEADTAGVVPRGWSHLTSVTPPRKDRKLQLTFAISQSNTDELLSTFEAVSDPSSPSYGAHLSLSEVREMTRPAPESVAAVTGLLKSHGVDEYELSAGDDFLTATVPIGVAEEMLSCRFGVYRHDESGAIALRATDYGLPHEVADFVDFVSPLKRFPKIKAEAIPPTAGVDDADINTPTKLRSLYNLGDNVGSADGNSMAVTAFLEQYYSETDLQNFYSKYYDALSGVPVANVIGPNDGTPGIEASLDVEYITVMGSGIRTEFWSFAGRAPDEPENEPFLDFLTTLGNTTDAPLVISTSYGEDEDSTSFDYATRINQEFQEAGARGISLLFASGDSGVGSALGSCTEFAPQWPSGSPYVTAVGATTGSSPETVAGLSSGGFSNRWAQPSWQADAVAGYLASDEAKKTDSSLYNATGRGFPDVAAQGTGFLVVNNGNTYPGVAGTSCSSPTFAGVVALVNDARIAAGKSPLGFLNPWLYSLPAGTLNDVTEGNNPGCGTDGFHAAEGWDPATGFGTPDYEKLVSAAMEL